MRFELVWGGGARWPSVTLRVTLTPVGDEREMEWRPIAGGRLWLGTRPAQKRIADVAESAVRGSSQSGEFNKA